MTRRRAVRVGFLASVCAAVLLPSPGMAVNAAAPTVPQTVPAARAGEPLTGDWYVALGDSFSSGEGTGDGDYSPTSDSDLNKCHRSKRSYSALLASDYFKAASYEFDACSNAVTYDMVNVSSQENYTPDGRRELAQLDHLSGNTRLVTLTIGGNDVGFAQIVSACISKLADARINPRCQDDPAVTAAFNDRLAALKGVSNEAKSGERNQAIYPWTDLLRRIREKAPYATILVAGYPVIFDPFSPAFNPDPRAPNDPGRAWAGVCAGATDALAAVRIWKDEALWMRSATVRLNAALQSAVEHSPVNDVHFVAVDDLFAGHDALAPRARWINRVPCERSIFSVWPGSFHPNATGQSSGYFQAFKNTLDDLRFNTDAPRLPRAQLPPIAVGEALTLNMQARWGTPPYRFAVSGALPVGFTLNSTTGILSGQSSTAGVYPITVRVQDSANRTDSVRYLLRVTGPLPTPSLVTAVRRISVKKPVPYAAKLETPVLKGVSVPVGGRLEAFVVASTKKYRDALLAETAQNIKDYGQSRCPQDPAAQFDSAWKGSVIADRYASVKLEFFGVPGCSYGSTWESVYAITVDLVTGDRLPLRYFVTGGAAGQGTYLTIVNAIGEQLGPCCWGGTGGLDVNSIQKDLTERYVITADGFEFTLRKYEGGLPGAAGMPSFVIPWESFTLTPAGTTIATSFEPMGGASASAD